MARRGRHGDEGGSTLRACLAQRRAHRSARQEAGQFRRPAPHAEPHQLDPPKRLSFTWGNSGDVTFALEPQGKDVLLTVIHRRLPDRGVLLMVGAGWHMHLDVLVAKARGTKTEPFWDGWTRLKAEYDRRLPA
jgi:uncharacterized protein YndB with AHSA1/START domain